MESKNLWLLVFVLFGLAILADCGGGSSGMPVQNAKAEFLYSIGTSGTPPNITFELLSFTVDPLSGALSLTSNIALTRPTVGIAVRPDSKFLYVSAPQLGSDFINIYSIDPTTGVPTPDGAFPLATVCPLCPPPSEPGALAMNSAGGNLYYGSITFGAGVAEGIGALASDDTSGALNFVPGTPFPANQVPYFIVVHPSGKFLYTEDTNAPQPVGFPLLSISGYSIDPGNGALAPVIGSPFVPPGNAEAAGFVVHPSGKFLYATSGAAMNGILAWSVDVTSGALTPIAGSPFQAGTDTIHAAFDPTGQFLYVSAGMTGILAFSVDSNTGALSPVSGSPFATGSRVGSLVVDPSGKFLLAQDGLNKSIVEFSRDTTTGTLAAGGSPLSVGASPGFLTIVPAP